MAKAQRPADKPKKAAEPAESKDLAKKSKSAKIEVDENDPLAEIKSAQKEEITSEAIPAHQLKKAKYEKQIPGQFDWEAFDTKGFGEGYSKDKREEMVQMYT